MQKELTPLMRQYWEIKAQHQDKILLFRMGDFYEIFYDDAKIAAPILNIALTSRNKKSEDETPMCGFPHHSISGPIGKLLNAGYKVALCDQLEDPELAKGIVKRGVTRILSPGMVYDPEALAEQISNYVAAIDAQSVSFLDASTGECFYYPVANATELHSLLAMIHPVELILTSGQKEKFDADVSSSTEALKFLIDQLLTTVFDKLENNWPERFSQAPVSARRLLTYASHMQGAQVVAAFGPFEQRSLNQCMHLGENTLKHLEVFSSYRAEDRGSLFYAINRTKTSAGARRLKSWLRAPLLQPEKIEERQGQVEIWTKKISDLKILRQTLGQMGDIERRLTKISYTNCQVRDLVALKQSLEVGVAISPLCKGFADGSLASDIDKASEIVALIKKNLVEDVPLNTKAGGFIRMGVSSELDELITLSENSQKLLLELEAREKENTQISSLKVRYNNVFGYYIEVTHTHKDKVPEHYKRKQTLANAERYITQELHELETKILSSRDRRLQLEEKLFQELRARVLSSAALIMQLAHIWSELDVLSSLAWLALEQKYVRPSFVKDRSLHIEGSRHPVIEQEVKKTFVPNSISLKEGECLLLTGPNMAGKSTLMRQVAVTALLAQIGSFVPAAKAELPLFEKIFTRIGASDSLSEGLSTFMVEMKETAEMLNGAGPCTLVILDEVGRGTSTYDGMSLAQAILEYLVAHAKSLTFFATHYHEITHLAQTHSQIRNAHMGVLERGNDIHFLYTLKSGPASKSYGIHVARLAGLPESVVRRADVLLKKHEVADAGFKAENGHSSSHSRKGSEVTPVVMPALSSTEQELVHKLKTYKTLEVTPLQAIQQIAQWQQDLS